MTKSVEPYGSRKNANSYYNFDPSLPSTEGLSYMFQGANNPGMFGKLKNWWGKNSGNIFSPALKAKFGNFANKAMSPQFNYTAKGGLSGWGIPLGKVANVANLGIQGYQAIKGLDELSDNREATGDIVADILASAANSPTIQYDLNASQLDTLRKLKRGTYDTESGFNDISITDALMGAGKGALTGAVGGWPGVIIGAIGGALNSGIGNLNKAQDDTNAELEALYQAVLESEQNYKNAKKQRAYANLANY